MRTAARAFVWLRNVVNVPRLPPLTLYPNISRKSVAELPIGISRVRFRMAKDIVMRENAELLPPVPASFMMYLCPPFPQHSIEKESRFGPVTKNDEQSENTEGLQQLDPVKQISTASPHIAASWLRDGQNLTLLQRVGHGLISLAYISAGVAVADGRTSKL